MDTSKKYIEMCEKAKEIQEQTQAMVLFDKGSYALVTDEYNKRKLVSLGEMSYYGDDHKWKIEVWLPRQDQLQEILSYTIQAELLNTFYTFAFRDSWCGKLDSMEQLWLAFVMKEKHNKTWDGKEWEK